MYNQVGQRVKGSYYGKEFTGTISNKECVNNGIRPAYAYFIKLDNGIKTSFGIQESVCWVDRDQGTDLEVIAFICNSCKDIQCAGC